MKTILIIGDGMADRPIKELDWKTPLQHGRTPFMDKLAELGLCGIMDPIDPGIPAGSDTAHLAILGYDPYKTYEGRGAFEALGAGLTVKPYDISFRVNFASVNDDLTVIDRRAGRIREGVEELAHALDEIEIEPFPEVQVIFKHTIEHRCAMIIRGPYLSRMISDSDPEEINRPINEVRPLDDSPQALRTSQIVNVLTREFHRILKNHPVNLERESKGLPPANAVIFRGAGVLPSVKPLSEIYGLKSLVVASGALYKGVCKSVGMDSIDVPGATGNYTTDTLAKARSAIKNLPKYDFILIHVKATDNASHDGDLEKKIMMIEKIDKIVEHLLRNTDPNETLIALTSDHSASLNLREHTGDPVPIAIKGPGVRVDSVHRFSEIDCSAGGLCRIRGINLMPILMNLLGKTPKFGE